jgi:hypothetical protein
MSKKEVKSIKDSKKEKTKTAGNPGECNLCSCKNYDPKYDPDPAPCRNCGHGAKAHNL